MPRKPRSQPNLLEMIPCRAVGSRTEEGGLATLLRPKFVSGPLARWLQPRLPRPCFRVHLDALGSFVWRRCDGQRSVAEIAEAVGATFPDEAQVLERVARFVRELARGQMVRLLEQRPR